MALPREHTPRAQDQARHGIASAQGSARVRSDANRFIDVHTKGVVVVPNTTAWTGPWLGATRAASLQRVANRPIVCHVLDALRAAGAREIVVVSPADVTRELSECIRDEGPSAAEARVHHVEHEPGGRDPLLAAAELVGESPCIVHRADGLLGASLAPLIDALLADGADGLLLCRDGESEIRRLRLVPRRRLDAEGEDANISPGTVAGVLVLGPGALGRLARNEEPGARVAGRGEELDLSTLARRLARAGGSVHTRSAHKWRHFDGQALDLLDLNRALLDTLDSELTLASTDGNRFEGPIAIHPSACVSSSVIIGPVMIGAEALIADSYIGPHTSIAERVRIEGAELERSIVLADASVLHVGGRLVASIVGRQARIFRDFSMPRALRLQVGDGDEVALC